jgi:hypothetical protein
MTFQKRAIREARKRLGERAEVIHYPVGHFDVYLGDNLETSVRDQISFLTTYLLKNSVC